jgi:hypothetical protein
MPENRIAGGESQGQTIDESSWVDLSRSERKAFRVRLFVAQALEKRHKKTYNRASQRRRTVCQRVETR